MATAVGRSLVPDAATERIDEIFAKWNGVDRPGCALGVVRDGELVHQAYYGMANLEHGVRHSPASVFDIASTTKQFTAAATLLLQQQGSLDLDDDVRGYVPELPDYGTTITVRHLIHHTSGLRDYINLRLLAGTHDGDYVDLQDALDIITRQRGLNFTPGSDHMYSNSGYALLAMIATRLTGRSFNAWCTEQIFEPLGMTTTRFKEDVTAIVPGMVQMYALHDDGGLRKTTDNEDVVGDGGLLSTVPDLARWERNFIEQRVGGPGFTETMSTPGTPAGVEERYAFGLSVGEHRGLRTVSHGGNLHGFSGEFLRFPEQRLAVICLANLGAFDASGLALKVADVFLEPLGEMRTVSAPPASGTAATARKAVDPAAVAGPYRDVKSGVIFDVARTDDGLRATLAGTEVPITAAEDGTLTALYHDTPIDVELASGDDGSPQIRFVYNGHAVLTGVRFDPTVAESADLEAYAGAYRSDELGVDAIVSVDDGQLYLQRGAAIREPLRPSLPDDFAMRYAGVRFTRDPGGDVAGFELNMARSAAVAFQRRH